MAEEQIKTLVALGLPEEQAKASVATYTADVAATHPVSCFYTHKINADADMDKVKAALKSYTENAMKAKGKIHCSHTINEEHREVQCIEVMNSPSAMDNHIGHCFPSYVQLLGAGCVMEEINAIVDESEREWWAKSLSAWGAKKFCVTAALN